MGRGASGLKEPGSLAGFEAPEGGQNLSFLSMSVGDGAEWGGESRPCTVSPNRLKETQNTDCTVSKLVVGIRTARKGTLLKKKGSFLGEEGGLAAIKGIAQM